MKPQYFMISDKNVLTEQTIVGIKCLVRFLVMFTYYYCFLLIFNHVQQNPAVTKSVPL